MPAPIIAVRTLEKINEVMVADQGASYRSWLGKVIPHMTDAYKADNKPHRAHMGASLMGRDCGREIWYGFRWATRPQFDGRMLRLFNRGHLEEARFIALLLMIGCQVYQQDENGKQYRISWANGHAGGSGDGIIIGCPDLPEGTACLTEFKTHSSKSFAALKTQGVKAAKFEHYGQMNLYMRKMGLAIALYMAVNKDTDEIYAELVPLDVQVADELLLRGENLVVMQTPPPKIAATGGFYKCRFCAQVGVCQQKKAPDKNCRTCKFSIPVKDAKWECTNPVCPGELSEDQQLAGCSHYEVSEVM